MLRRVLAEKDKVLADVRASQNDLRQAARYLTPEQLAPLREDFRFLLDAALLQREWVRAYFAQREFIDRYLEGADCVLESDALASVCPIFRDAERVTELGHALTGDRAAEHGPAVRATRVQVDQTVVSVGP